MLPVIDWARAMAASTLNGATWPDAMFAVTQEVCAVTQLAAEAWAAADKVEPTLSEQALKLRIYRGQRQAVLDRIRLAYAAARQAAVADNDALIRAGNYARLLQLAENWQAPAFPVTGADLLQKGFSKGPELGAALRRLETLWIDSGFGLDRRVLLDKLDQNSLL